jgi:DNA-binding MarR family transcriptional regulator
MSREIAEQAHDAVDAAVAAWARERPGLDMTPMTVVSRVERLARILERADGAVLRAHGLENWEFDMLATLRRSGPPYELTPGQLLQAALVTSGAQTNRINRLEARGLVERRESPADGRVRLVRLTQAGSDLVDGVLPDHLANKERLVAPLGSDERRAVADALRRLLLALGDTLP